MSDSNAREELTVAGTHAAARRAAIALAGALIVLILGPAPGGAQHETATLTIAPTADRKGLGTNHVVTATIAGATSYPIDIDFEITGGPNAIQGLDKTDGDTSQADFTCVVENSANLSCPINYTDTRAKPGETDAISAWIDHDRNDSTFEGFAANANVTWGGQLGARQHALLSGPIEQDDLACSVDRRRRGGRIAAVARLCQTRYLIEEADPKDDHGVLWLQVDVKARGGSCVTRVRSDLEVPEDALLGPMAPEEALLVKKGSSVGSTELSFEPPETETAAGVSQTYYVYPGRLTTRLVDRDGADIWRLVWRKGEARRPTAFAHGFAYSWPQGEAPPDFPSPSAAIYRVVPETRCR
jgi:hypothetical protein